MSLNELLHSSNRRASFICQPVADLGGGAHDYLITQCTEGESRWSITKGFLNPHTAGLKVFSLEMPCRCPLCHRDPGKLVRTGGTGIDVSLQMMSRKGGGFSDFFYKFSEIDGIYITRGYLFSGCLPKTVVNRDTLLV